MSYKYVRAADLVEGKSYILDEFEFRENLVRMHGYYDYIKNLMEYPHVFMKHVKLSAENEILHFIPTAEDNSKSISVSTYYFPDKLEQKFIEYKNIDNVAANKVREKAARNGYENATGQSGIQGNGPMNLIAEYAGFTPSSKIKKPVYFKGKTRKCRKGRKTRKSRKN